MEKVNRPQDKWLNLVFFSVGLLIIFADQFSKTWIRANIPIGQSILNIGLFRITHINNSGAAFGLLPSQSFVLTIAAFIGIAAVLFCALLPYRCLPLLNNTLGKLSLGLVLGGTIGNLIDRLRSGYVTDFIDFRVWPAFNVADSAVTVGVAIILVIFLLRWSQAEKQ